MIRDLTGVDVSDFRLTSASGSALPAGVTSRFEPTSVRNCYNCFVTLTVVATNSAVSGRYPLTMRATGHGDTQSASITLDITGGTYSAGGQVTSGAGTGLAGVSITFTRVSGTGAVPGAVTTDSGGRWSRSGIATGTMYRATAALGGYTFSPATRDFSSAASNQSLLVPTLIANPVAYSASGRVTGSSRAGLGAVRMTFTRVSGIGAVPAAVTTDSRGNWSQSGFEGGSVYRASPALSGWRFSPSSRDFSAAGTLASFTGSR